MNPSKNNLSNPRSPQLNRYHQPKFLVRHVGNMGDMIFIVPPVLAALKQKYPDSHITFVTSWGFKQPPAYNPYFGLPFWGQRNLGGHSLHLMMTNPHIDSLVHWHDHKTSLSADICFEDGQAFPTWSRSFYKEQKKSDAYDRVIELDFGLTTNDNPVAKAMVIAGLPPDQPGHYTLYLSESDISRARDVMGDYPSPRIVLLEGLQQSTTRGWDPEKFKQLADAIRRFYGVDPIYFGAQYTPYWHGKPLSLRENIATLTYCNLAIGVLSGPLHFAAAVDLPTITLYCDHPLHRAAPAYFQNISSSKAAAKHRTILGPHRLPLSILKAPASSLPLTPDELATQNYSHWSNPGRQSTKSCLSVITVDEVITVLQSMLN